MTVKVGVARAWGKNEMLYIVGFNQFSQTLGFCWLQNKYLVETYLSWTFEKMLQIFLKQRANKLAVVHQHCWKFPKAK